jgi:Na+/proline symporter
VVAVSLKKKAQTMNVALLIAAGVGGMVAATAGPIFTGIAWRGTTKAGALAGFTTGAIVFIATKSGLIEAAWFSGTSLETAGTWLADQAANPFACGTIGALISVATVVAVSLVTERPSEAHLRRVYAVDSNSV